MTKYDIGQLKSLSNNTICSIPYPDNEIKKWKEGDISFLLKSNAPRFIKDILEHKKRKYIVRNKKKEVNKRYKSTWYFGEGYVASIFGDVIEKGWFSSFKWLYDPDWVTGKNPDQEEDPVIAKLKQEFYVDALMEYIGPKQLEKLQRLGKKEGAKAPDLWLIDREKRHYFIEVKKETDKPDKKHKQLIGLALLERFLTMPTFLVYLYPENKKTLSGDKQVKWLSDYITAKMVIKRQIK